MNSSAGYLFAIVFFVLALNLYFVVSRMRRGNKRRRTDRVAPDEAKQAVWRDREIKRRLEREQDGALERVKLKNETLALYEEVRRRHAYKDHLDSLGINVYKTDDEPYDSELNSYLQQTGQSTEQYANREPQTEVITEPDNDERDPFDIFKENKR